RADLVPASDDSALEEREGGFNGIGMDIAAHVYAIFVLDSFVLSTLDAGCNHRRNVRGELVCDDYINVGADIFFYVLRQSSSLDIGCMKESEFSATLPDADHNFFVVVLAVPALAFALTSADPCFINFNSTVEHWLIHFLHSSTNAMAEIPRGF